MTLASSALGIRSIITQSQAVGATVPASLIEALENHERTAEAAATLYIGGTALEDAVAAALDAGKDPTVDKTVQRILASRQIGAQGVVQSVVQSALGRLVAAAEDVAHDLLEAWRAPFDQAAADIAAGYKILGDIELHQAEEILRKGGAAAEAWIKANAANQRIKDIRGLFVQLSIHTAFVPHSPANGVLIITEPTYDQWTGLGLREARIDPWNAHRMGLTLRLATPEEFTTLPDQYQAEWHRRQQADQHRQAGKFTPRELVGAAGL
ncbi:hypothetical protein C5D09_14795 [Rathayibacter sp. AY1C9]|uniref:hypothetical protein n=1 Tax=Rathayibacter sp. AY1C9 TaxID=2080541 RepID=UPI000CE8D440|nr:hypothetical protein [Rathayibacter sp. AY1C9]PPH43456.1 hypothetical protein C5D09_14795 [Rathayibacter sp. AY1C9]